MSNEIPCAFVPHHVVQQSRLSKLVAHVRLKKIGPRTQKKKRPHWKTPRYHLFRFCCALDSIIACIRYRKDMHRAVFHRPEIVSSVAKHLYLDDISSMRQVCKQWHSAINGMRLQTFAVPEARAELGHVRWILPVDDAKTIETLHIDNSEFLHTRRLRLAKCLRHLVIAPTVCREKQPSNEEGEEEELDETVIVTRYDPQKWLALLTNEQLMALKTLRACVKEEDNYFSVIHFDLCQLAAVLIKTPVLEHLESCIVLPFQDVSPTHPTAISVPVLTRLKQCRLHVLLGYIEKGEDTRLEWMFHSLEGAFPNLEQFDLLVDIDMDAPDAATAECTLLRTDWMTEARRAFPGATVQCRIQLWDDEPPEAQELEEFDNNASKREREEQEGDSSSTKRPKLTDA